MDGDFSAHPTSFLPPLGRLASQSTHDVASAIAKLRNLYWPPKPPPVVLPAKITLPQRNIARLIHDDSVPDSGYASAEEEEDDDDVEDKATDSLELLRADTLQREFAIKWTTGFISRSELWAELAPTPAEYAARTDLLEDVTALLSAFAGFEGGDEEEPVIVRTFAFATPCGTPVTVQLNDEPLLEEDHTSVGLQSWGSAIRLAERLCADPDAFSLVPDMSGRSLRVLELGAGTGLLSIVAAKLLAPSAHPPVIVATDYHRDVLENLSTNVNTNFPSSTSSPNPTPTPIHVHVLDWETPVYAPPFLDAPFDIIFAADVVYHPEHARWIRGCVEQLLRRPCGETDGDEGGVFWMIIAVRPIGRHQGLDGSVAAVFGDEARVLGEEGTRLRLAILEMEEPGKVEGVGRADESGYKLFKIGWKAVGGGASGI
ncbi:putative methyltransferase-domain-containing protein [Lyophyllum atratum]|nr:putative methyltransferase-domain-containing protein [Lyophyllum atratum]